MTSKERSLVALAIADALAFITVNSQNSNYVNYFGDTYHELISEILTDEPNNNKPRTIGFSNVQNTKGSN